MTSMSGIRIVWRITNIYVVSSLWV